MNQEIIGLIQELADKVDKYTSSTPPLEFSFVMDDKKLLSLTHYSTTDYFTTTGFTIHTSTDGIINLQDPSKVVSLLEKVGKKKDLSILYKMDTIMSSNNFSVQQYIHSLRIGYIENILHTSVSYTQTIDYLENVLDKMSIGTTKEFNKIKDNSCIPNKQIGSYTYWSWLIVPCFVTLTESLPIKFEDKLS